LKDGEPYAGTQEFTRTPPVEEKVKRVDESRVEIAQSALSEVEPYGI
jgi:hypothetical protein